MKTLNNLYRAKIFCEMSFAASDQFPCVTSYHASEIYNKLFFAETTAEDFHALLVEFFGEKYYIGNEIFRLNRKNFFNRAYRSQKNGDWQTFDRLADELENLLKAKTAFEGGDLFEIHSGYKENYEFPCRRKNLDNKIRDKGPDHAADFKPRTERRGSFFCDSDQNRERLEREL